MRSIISLGWACSRVFPFLPRSSKVLERVSVMRPWVSSEPPTTENFSAVVIRLWPSWLSRPMPTSLFILGG